MTLFFRNNSQETKTVMPSKDGAYNNRFFWIPTFVGMTVEYKVKREVNLT